MLRTRLSPLIAAVALVVLPNAAAAEKPAATGTVKGVVTFKGKPPAPVKISKVHDPFCADKVKVDEKVVVKAGKLRDVHVGLPSGSAGTHKAPASTVVVDQSGCMYRPRVVGAIAGQKVEIKNSDHTFHNVRGTHGEQAAFNHGQPQKFPAIHETPGKAGQTLTLRCDIHPWMRGYAVVTDHPFFDVSAGDGSFEITGVPVGTHTVRAWHPELGAKTAKVVVTAGAVATVSFEYP